MRPEEQHDSRSRVWRKVAVILIGVSATATVTLLNVPGDRHPPSGEHIGGFVNYSSHGWPIPYLVRRQEFSTVPHPLINVWNLTDNIESFYPYALAVDLTLAGALIGAIVAATLYVPVPRLRWTFSLRTFMAMAVSAAVAVGLFAKFAETCNRHSKLVAALRALNASAVTTPGDPDWVFDLVPNDAYRIWDHYDCIAVDPAAFARDSGLGDDSAFYALVSSPLARRDVTQLSFAGCNEFDDSHLAKLLQLDNLKRLDVGDTSVTDEGVRLLKALPQLRFVNISGTQVSDNAIEYLIDIPNLDAFSFGRSRITRVGYDRFRQNRMLRQTTDTQR